MADFDERLKQIVSEVPKLDAACKNLCSALIAESNSRSETDQVGPRRTELQWINTMKLFYRELQRYELLDSPQYGLEHPQTEDQTAIDRIEQLTRYNVIKACHDKVRSSGNKPGKYFGKRYFTWAQGTLEEIRDRAKLQLSEELQGILDEFVDALSVSLVDTTSEDDMETSRADLVWAVDFNKALQARQKRRERKAQTQASRLEEELTSLSTAVGAGESVRNSSDSRVEELSGDDNEGGDQGKRLND